MQQYVEEEQDVAPAMSIEQMQSRVEELCTEKNALKQKVSELNADLIEKEMAVKAMSLHIQRLEEENRKLKAENESLRVARKKIGSMSMARSKRTAKGTLKLSESVKEEHLGLALQVDKIIPQ